MPGCGTGAWVRRSLVPSSLCVSRPCFARPSACERTRCCCQPAACGSQQLLRLQHVSCMQGGPVLPGQRAPLLPTHDLLHHAAALVRRHFQRRVVRRRQRMWRQGEGWRRAAQRCAVQSSAVQHLPRLFCALPASTRTCWGPALQAADILWNIFSCLAVFGAAGFVKALLVGRAASHPHPPSLPPPAPPASLSRARLGTLSCVRCSAQRPCLPAAATADQAAVHSLLPHRPF